MSDTTCEIDGCVKPRYQKRRMCSTHTMRLHRYGDPFVDRRKHRGVCKIDNCGKPHAGLGWCKEHYDRYLRTGDPTTTFAPRKDLTYAGAHSRVRLRRGPASLYVCQCGQPAYHWAYDHLDPNELGDKYRYSLDPDHYLPLCTPCHKRLDLAWVKARLSPAGGDADVKLPQRMAS